MESWREVAYLVVGLFIGVILHEYMHARIADMRGDHTARNAGRLTLNPLPHIDPFGTILLPLALVLLFRGNGPVFGYAKPVPVNPFFLRRRKDMMYVALAGPLTNFAIAGIFTLVGAVIHLAGIRAGSSSSAVYQLFLLLYYVAAVNVLLGVFNLIPIPPLDGSQVLSAFLSHEAQVQYERLAPYGFVIIFALLWLAGNLFFKLISPLYRLIASAMGI